MSKEWKNFMNEFERLLREQNRNRRNIRKHKEIKPKNLDRRHGYGNTVSGPRSKTKGEI